MLTCSKRALHIGCHSCYVVIVHIGTAFIWMILGMQDTAAAIQRNQQRSRLSGLKEGAISPLIRLSHGQLLHGRQKKRRKGRIVRRMQTGKNSEESNKWSILDYSRGVGYIGWEYVGEKGVYHTGNKNCVTLSDQVSPAALLPPSGIQVVQRKLLKPLHLPL